MIFDWDEKTQGLILGAFFWGYLVTHMPGGILAEKFGGKWTLGLGILSTAVLTLLTPVVVKAGGASALIALRVVEGLGEVHNVVRCFRFIFNIISRYIGSHLSSLECIVSSMGASG
jgi:MFS family permease